MRVRDGDETVTTSDSDEWDDDDPLSEKTLQRIQRLFSDAGGKMKKKNLERNSPGDGDEDSADASAQSESGSSRSRSQSASPRDHLPVPVLKLTTAADGQMQSRLVEARHPRVSPPHSHHLATDFIAQLRNTKKRQPHERASAESAAAPPLSPPPPAARPAARRPHDHPTATVSREQYLRLEEKYNRLEERHQSLLKKYYWIEKKALILVEMLNERGDADASETDALNIEPPAEKVLSSGTPGRTVGVRQRGARVQLAPGVWVARAPWRALRAERRSRVLVRRLALCLFSRRDLLLYSPLPEKQVEAIRGELRRRLAVEGAFPADRGARGRGPLQPAQVRAFLQQLRAQLRWQNKQPRTKKPQISVRNTRGTGAVGAITCRQCNKRFTSRSHLTVHARTHSGERPYSCSECDETFVRHWQFNQHARAHGAGVRARVCDTCGLSFPQLAHLHWHARRTHGAPPPPHAARHKPVKPHADWLDVPLLDADDLAH